MTHLRTTRLKTALKASTAAALCLATLPVAAAEEADSDQDIDEIIVVGQKVDRTLREVTSSVTVETGAEIEREPLVDLYDIVDRIPNVTSSFGGLGFAIRGVDQRGVAGSGATLTIYVDDAPLGNQTTFFGPLGSWDLGQVEVYRGPQSTNFGRNSLAGAIYIRTKDPSFDWEAKARAEIGNNGAYHGAVAFGGPLVDDKLAFRVAAEYRETDGFIRNTFLDEDADATELWNTRLKLLFQPTENFQIITTSSYTENFAGEDIVSSTNNTPGTTPNAKDVIREVTYDTPGREGTETFIQSVNAEWEISERVSIQSITSFQTTDYVRQEDFDLTSLPIASLDRTGDDEALAEELRVRYNDERLSLILGFYYVDTEDGFEDEFTVPGSLINPFIPPSIFIGRVSSRVGESTNYAGFMDGEYKLNDEFDLLFGLRYDREEQDNFQSTVTTIIGDIPPGFEFLLGLAGTETSTTNADFDAWLPKAGIRWNASDDATFAFVVQRAYRAGGAEINFVDNSLAEFDPEYLWNYELSARISGLDGALNWNTNIYYSDWSDQQTPQPLAPPFQNFFQTVNAGSSTLYGFETDISYSVSDQLDIYAGVGYSKTEFDEFVNGEFDPTQPESEFNQANFNGNSFPFAPEWSFNAGFDYTHDSGFFGGVDVNYQDNSFNEVDNFTVNIIDSRFLVNARVGYEIREGVRLSGYVRNLFDEQYFTTLNRVNQDGARLGDEFTWAIRLDVDF